jgi:class 3 adenylate cyclase/tetratricopeptide (TPR) repeat protein
MAVHPPERAARHEAARTLRAMSSCPRCGVESPDGANFCPGCGSPFAPGRPGENESRRVVTILFTDVVGSTALGELLDPETFRGVMARYFGTMTAVIERHGGTIEKYIGDAIMAVFGLPLLHEDDALRAVRAAVEMREALVALNVVLENERGVTIAARTGIETGEVVAGDATTRQTLVTGDPVNTAARLEQAADPGEILVGVPTWRLVAEASFAEPVAPIDAKGKAGQVPAMRLLRVGGVGHETVRAGSGTLVGRDAELGQLGAAFDRVLGERQPALVTVLGPAGVGKSRLVAEFVASVAHRATVLRGRCLSYGEGITYWPIREILVAAAGIAESDTPKAGRRKLDRLVRNAPDGPLLAARLGSAIGLSTEPAPQEELFWAIRRTMEHLAAARALVLVIEDIHWAEPTLMELVEQLIDLGRDVPLLVVCPTRPEVRDTIPGWGRGPRNAIEIALGGLTEDATAGLIDSLPGGRAIPAGLRARILAAAEGNPLFLEEMVRMLVDEGVVAASGGPVTGHPAAVARVAEAVAVPPTIGALLAARLDRLPVGERSTAQRASVVGRVFEQVAVAALTPANAAVDLTASLLALVRRDLVAAEGSELTATGVFKFRHILIRDAAYDALSKADRAELHERFAGWLERAAGDRLMEYEEILAHHLGLAHRYRTELRQGGDRTAHLGERAAAHLIAAAERARDRGDSAAAAELCKRAEGLPIADARARSNLHLQHGHTLFDLGRTSDAVEQADRALAIAGEVGDWRLAARARLLRLAASIADGVFAGSDSSVGIERSVILSEAEASGDPLALALARQSLSEQAWTERRFVDAVAQTRLAVDSARATGDARFELEIECEVLPPLISGPTRAGAAVAVGEELLGRAGEYPTIRARILNGLAIAEAMLGRAAQARAHADEASDIYRDLAQPIGVAEVQLNKCWVARLAGDLTAAEAEVRQVLDGDHVDAGIRPWASWRLGDVLIAQGRIDEAEEALRESERDPVPVLGPRRAALRARIDAARGESRAVAEIIELLTTVAGTPFINQETDALVEAAESMASLGHPAAAAIHARRALDLAEAKENLALAAQIRVLLARVAG